MVSTKFANVLNARMAWKIMYYFIDKREILIYDHFSKMKSVVQFYLNILSWKFLMIHLLLKKLMAPNHLFSLFSSFKCSSFQYSLDSKHSIQILPMTGFELRTSYNFKILTHFIVKLRFAFCIFWKPMFISIFVIFQLWQPAQIYKW